MWRLLSVTLVLITAVSGGGQDFVTEPQDAAAAAGDTVQLDCELVQADQGDICAWKIRGTHLGVDHFYNVFPPPKVHALFPEHERVCSIVVENIDWRHDGLWTCWPLGLDSHVSSREANVTVRDWRPSTTTAWPTTPPPSPDPTSTAAPSTTPPPAPSTTPPPAPSTTSPPAPSTTPPPPPTTTTPWPAPTTTVAPPTSPSPAPSTPSPGPGFQCPAATGLFADPLDARYFYYCQDWVPVHMQCETGLWDDDAIRCR